MEIAQITDATEKMKNLEDSFSDLKNFILSVDALTKQIYLGDEQSSSHFDSNFDKKIESFAQEGTVMINKILQFSPEEIRKMGKEKIEELQQIIPDFLSSCGELLEALFRKKLGHIGGLEKIWIEDLQDGKKFVDLEDWKRSLILPVGGLEEVGQDILAIIKKFGDVILNQDYENFDIRFLWEAIKKVFQQEIDISQEDLDMLGKSITMLWENFENIFKDLSITTHEQINMFLDVIISVVMILLSGGVIKKGIKTAGMKLGSVAIRGEKIGEKRMGTVVDFSLKMRSLAQAVAIFTELVSKTAKLSELLKFSPEVIKSSHVVQQYSL